MKKKLREVMRRVERWPEEQQDSAAKILLAMEAQARSSHRLTEEQAEEVERRLAEPAPRFLSLEEVRSRFAKRSA